MEFSTAISHERKEFKQNYLVHAFLATFGIIWAYTFIGTPDFANWLLENTLTFLFLTSLAISYRKFKFSDLSYTFIFIYLCLHVYGAMYTYAENPFGYWLQENFQLARNHYDRIVHFSFGFMLAYPMRDLFRNWFKFPSWVNWVLPVEITLSFSALYELIEWVVADVFFKAQGDAYLGTQGDIWDAQKDMFLAFSGSILVLILVFLTRKALKLSK
jgi:putative membrane protein